jgi:hypothetical protein
MDEQGIHAPADEEDVEAHGLKETVAAAAAVGALAVPAAAQAYVPNLESGDRIEVATTSTQTAKVAGKKSAKKAAKKKQQQSPTGLAGLTSPKKPLLDLEEP